MGISKTTEDINVWTRVLLALTPSVDKASCDPRNLPLSRVLCGNNNELTQMPCKPGNNFQKVNAEIKIVTRSCKKSMTVLAVHKSPSSLTECNVNISVTISVTNLTYPLVTLSDCSGVRGE